MRIKILNIILVIALLAGGMYSSTASVSAAGVTPDIVNGDFEEGFDDDGWPYGWIYDTEPDSSLAYVTVANNFDYTYDGSYVPEYTIAPDMEADPDNGSFALLYPGEVGVLSIISQPFTASTGDWISGEACFGSGDYEPYSDIAEVMVTDEIGNTIATVFSIDSGTIGGIRSSGWIHWAYKFTTSGTYAIRAQVANEGDAVRSSVLALDNVTNTPINAPYTLTLPQIGSGTITADGQPVTGNKVTGLAEGTAVNLTATPAPGWSFNGWSGSASGSDASITITMNSDKTVVAAFSQTMNTLTIYTNGNGSVTATADINGELQTVTSGASLPWGTNITLNAVPDAGWSFSNWSGGTNSTSQQTAISLTSNLSVTANFTHNVYTLTVDTTGTGAGLINRNNPGPYYYGNVVQLTAVPDAGSSFSGWGGALDGTANPATLTINGNTTVTANFTANPADESTISAGTTGSGTVVITVDGAVVQNGSGVNNGTTVTLTANAASGWSYNSWSGDISGSTNPTSFIINQNTTVNAVFTQNEYTLTVNTSGGGSVTRNNSGPYHYGDVVQLTAIPQAGYYFSGWGGVLTGTTNPASVTIGGNTTVSASFDVNPVSQYTLSVDIIGTGTVTRTPDQSYYTSGTAVDLTANPAAGWNFVNWQWTDPVTGNPVTATSVSTSITMVGNLAVTATFQQNVTNQYTVTITTNGSGTAGIDPPGGIYTGGDQIELNAAPYQGWSFSHWSGTISGTANPLIVTVSSNMTISANFTHDTYILVTNVNIAGSGTVLGNSTNYHYGDQVPLTAVPANGWEFVNWSGDAVGAVNPLTITITGNTNITANFSQVIPELYTLTVTQSGSGVINISPLSASYAFGALVTLTAVPNSEWMFNRWTGDATGSTNPLIVTMNSNKTVKAHFNALNISSSKNPSRQGKEVTFTSTVSIDPTLVDGQGNVIQPTGTIQFNIDGSDYSSPVNMSSGSASLQVNGLSEGDHPVTGRYSGDAHYPTATLPGLIQKVENTSVNISSSLNPATYGENVIFTAAVIGVFDQGDTVTFKDGTGELGTGTLDSSGQAYYSTSSLTAGNHALTAEYSDLTSGTLDQRVDKAVTTTSLTVDSSVSGSYILTAQVNGVSIPTGQVVFLEGYLELGTADLISGQAVLSGIILASGHTITAEYTGDDNFSNSISDPVIEFVKFGTVVELDSSLNPSVFGQGVTFTAEVTSDDGTPAGTVIFSDGSGTIWSAGLDENGAAQYTTSALGAGDHDIIVQYEGNDSYNGSSTGLTQTVSQAATETIVTASNSESGDSYVLTAMVNAAAPGAGVPTGQVTFLDGSLELGTADLISGQAVLSGIILDPGTHTITAEYTGDDNFSGSASISITEIIQSNNTTTVLISSVNPSIYGQPVNFTATVTSDTGIPEGRVVFSADGEVLCTVDMVDGVAQYETSALDAGDHIITSEFLANDNYQGSSAGLTQTVRKDKTVTRITSSLNPSKEGQSVTFTASVTGSVSPAVPGGTVVFKDGDSKIGTATLDASGKAVLTTDSLEAGCHKITAVYKGDSDFKSSTSRTLCQKVYEGCGRDKYRLIILKSQGGTVTADPDKKLFARGEQVTLTANPDPGYVFKRWVCVLNSKDNPLTLTMNSDKFVKAIFKKTGSGAKIDTTITLTIPDGTVATGQAKIIATVLPVSGNGNPTGKVIFYNGTTKIGKVTLTGSTATLKTDCLPAGKYLIKAVYSGDDNFNGSSVTADHEFILYQNCQFVIWGGNQGGYNVNNCVFWSSQWEKQVTGGKFPGNASFKGFANNVGDSSWSTDPGNSCRPPESIGKYISVIVATKITKKGSVISGNINKVVLVEVDDPSSYQSNPGHSCSGKVIAELP